MRLATVYLEVLDFFRSSLSLNLLSHVHNRTTLDITMSFGYGVGDFIAVCQLANQLRERFADAPSQFKAISNE
jgi:hypothetical protein